MATNHTTNYNLNLWEANDKFVREEFNQDNAKIDAALGGMLGKMELIKEVPLTLAINSNFYVDISDINWADWSCVVMIMYAYYGSVYSGASLNMSLTGASIYGSSIISSGNPGGHVVIFFTDHSDSKPFHIFSLASGKASYCTTAPSTLTTMFCIPDHLSSPSENSRIFFYGMK